MGVRRAGLVTALVGLVQVTAGSPASSGVAAPDGCEPAEAIFAVRGSNGHLVELESCPDALTEVGEVDTGDWRSASRILATGDGTVTVVYQVTADGRLEARRQAAPGAPLEAPVEVGAGIDWSRFRTVLVPRQGYLWADDGTVRTFRHEGWATGGGDVVEGPPVFAARGGGPGTGDLELTGLGPGGRAEAYFAGTHWLVWRGDDGLMAARASGRIPHGAAGAEWRPGLFLAADGAVSRLTQPLYKGPDSVGCPANPMSWQVRTRLPGDWWFGVVVPQRTASPTWPGIARPPSSGKCPPGTEPYQWQ